MYNDTEFNIIISEFLDNNLVNKMKNFKQHCNTSCFEHCLNVAYYSYKICKKYNLDYKSATRAAMLHDLFLYDWRIKNNRKGLHAFTHPKSALINAEKCFVLNNKEKDIILKHMWPVTFYLPKSKEAFIVSCADKYSALEETLLYMKSKVTLQKLYRLSYVFLSMTIIRFI